MLKLEHKPNQEVSRMLGRVIRGRGAMNQRGPERALLNAIESVITMEETLPVNLLVVAEGEEGLGSPHYPEIIDRYEDRVEKGYVDLLYALAS